jgi:hypothetical protein
VPSWPVEGVSHAIGPVAQLAEQQTLNLRVGGSIPPRLTKISQEKRRSW